MTLNVASPTIRVPAAVVLACACAGIAQDRRTITEPTIPVACVTLQAKLHLRDGKLAAADEQNLDTARIQRALDTCAAHMAVELAAGMGESAFLTGPISIPTGVTLLVDRGVTLLASRDARLYDVRPGDCGVVNDEPEGCRPLIAIAHAPHAAVMGEGTIDGRGGEKLLHGNLTWWELAEQARKGGRQQVPRLIVADGSDDFTLYGIALRNSANFHVVYQHGRGFTAWGLKIDTPRTARNTDGIDPGPAENITVTHSFISTGDDNIAIKGSGGGVAYMSVLDNHFYSGHGMSIGSETFGGVHDVLVRNLSLDGTDNGLRIKSNPSRGGLVDRITYSNVCIRGSKRPIVLDTHYDNPGPRRDLFPEFRNVRLEDVRIFGGGTISVEGVDAQHRVSLTLDGVTLDDPTRYPFHASHAAIAYGPGPVNFTLAGDDVTGPKSSGKGDVTSCDRMFVPFEP